MANKIVIRGDAKEVMKMFDDIQRGAKQTEKTTETATKGMKLKWEGLGTAVNAVMGGLGLKVAADMIKSSERMGLALDILKVKNKDVYNQLQQTEKATFGLANQFDMVTAANKALAFGIDLSDGKLGTLTKISTKLAAVMGIDVKQAFDDLIVSSARQQKLIADNLGLMIDKVAVDKAYAKQLGITKGELTEQQQSQAFLNEILKKGNIITAELGDEFIKTRTKGTQALKGLETFAKTSLNAIAATFVGVGEAAGWMLAVITNDTKDSTQLMYKELSDFNQWRVESEKLTLKELQDLRKITSLQNRERQKAIMLEYGQYYIELQKLKGEHEFEMQQAENMENFFDRRQAKQKEEKAYLLRIKKLNDDFNLGIKEGRAIDFVDFELILNKKFLTMRNHIVKMQKMIKGSSVFSIYSSLWAGVKDADNQIKADRENKLKQQQEWWKKNGDKIIANRKAEIKDIVSFNKELIGYSAKSNEEKIKLDEKYAQQEKALLTKKISELKALKLQAAKELDVKVGVDSEEKRRIEKANNILKIENDLNNSIKESNEKRRLQAIEDAEKEAKKILALKKAQIAQEQALQMKANSFYVGAAKDVLTAVINGNAAAIPEMLAQKAFMYGTDLVMDGIMHQLSGTAKLASPLTAVAGAFEVKAGSAEVAQGLPWMLGGGLAVAGLNIAGGGSSSSDTSKTTGAEDRNEFNQAVNKEEKEAVIVFQYDDKNDLLNQQKRLNKRLNKGGF